MARPTTPRYGLIKYGPQGTGDPLGVYSAYNPTMDIIDTIMGSLQDQIDALDGRVTKLEARMDAVEKRLDNHDQHLTTIDNHLTNIDNHLTQLDGKTDSIWEAIRNIVGHVYGGGSVNTDSGAVTWGATGTVAVGNMNVYGGGADASAPNAIRTRADSTSNTNDVRVV